MLISCFYANFLDLMLCRYIVPCGLTSLQPVSIKVGGYAYSKIEYVKICVYLINFDFYIVLQLITMFYST